MINKTLDDLDVQVMSQTSLEQEIENNAEDLLSKQSIEQEENLLERYINKLNVLRHKKQRLEEKYEDTQRISVRARIEEQLENLNNDEIIPLEQDLREIRQRIKALKSKDDEVLTVDSTNRQPGESEKDYLMRTGQITGFGNQVNFTTEEEEDANSKSVLLAERQIFGNISEEQTLEDIEQNEEIEGEANDNPEGRRTEPITTTKRANETVDDGDEYHYQQRLKKWICRRSKDRETDTNLEAPEWLKPHPKIPDARLNDDFKVPGDIFPLLFAYQKTCVQWLCELYQQECGGIIGDEMGLGKTIQIIAFLATLHHSNKLDGPILIVCPATVMKQWCNEFHTWWPPLRTIILHSIGAGMNRSSSVSEEEMERMLMESNYGDFTFEDYENKNRTRASLESRLNVSKLVNKVISDGHVIITTYVGLRIHAETLLNVKWSYAVLDEGHKIRSPDSDISLTCKKLKTRNRIILSGTPIQNNLIELWSLFDFVYPGKLGTLPVFQQQFANPINAGGYANASNIQVKTGYKCAVALRDLISPYLLRRVKSDVARDLPKKNEMVLFCKLTKYQRMKYLEFLHSDDLVKIRKGKRQVLFGIDILRKICNHPDLLDLKIRNRKDYDDDDFGNPSRSGKMQIVKQLLLLWKSQQNKTLLFTQSRQMLDILEDFIQFKDPELSNIKYLRMDGTTNVAVRQSLVDRFNNENYDVFLLTTRVGGLGVNLTGANRIIIFDPDWNPSTDMQARERAWRIGQKREVTIYRLMVAGSIEEKIYHRQIFKQFLSNKILKDPKQKRFFKMNDLHDLFTLGGDNGYETEEFNEEIAKQTDELRASKNVGANEFDKLSQISGVHKLESFFNTKENDEKKKNDEERLIGGMFNGSASIENDSKNDLISEEASRLANSALAEIKKSRRQTKKFEIGTPTWTGKFGQAGRVRKRMDTRLPKHNPTEQPPVSPPNFSSSKVVTKESHSEIASNIRESVVKFFLSIPDCAAKSAEIVMSIGLKLNNPEDVENVRSILREVATFDKINKKWVLKESLKSW